MVSGTGPAEGKSLPVMVGLAVAAVALIGTSLAGVPRNANDKDRYAQSLFNSIVKCVPIGGVASPRQSPALVR